MATDEKRTDLEMAEELFAFLQGEMPDRIHLRSAECVPKLTADQAWTVVWYLGNLYWQVSDYIERCGVCGDLYDSNSGGDCLDYGDYPYNFCDPCTDSPEYAAKKRTNDDS